MLNSNNNSNNNHHDSNNLNNITGSKRKSRFDTDIIDPVLPEQKRLNLEISQAAAKAAEISKELNAKIQLVASLIGNPNLKFEKKAAYRPLLLDAQGREIDEHGNLVKHEIQPVKTLAANLAAVNANKKKENPYLAHRAAPVQPVAAVAATPTSISVPLVGSSSSAAPVAPPVVAAENVVVTDEIIVDERLPSRKREMKGKKALQFVEPGKFIKEATRLQEKEEKKAIAGYASGRKQLEKAALTDSSTSLLVSSSSTTAAPVAPPVEEMTEEMLVLQHVAPPIDTMIPTIEWWDECFLPKQKRELRKISKIAQQDETDYDHLSINHVKTHKYIQHPLPIKPITSQSTTEKSIPVIPMYLTKKERKKLRRSIRAEREKDKRDKMMLGLIPTPEPKFKLSNFMKLLGDQAVADPSKIEMKVIQQIQKRILNHEMRNQANKLTPQEKKTKKLKKLQSDLSHGLYTILFRLTDFRCLKYRFQVDITAQQLLLSGLVILCENEDHVGGMTNPLNLVIVEGGMKSLRKFSKLMTKRIKWDWYIPPNKKAEDTTEEGGGGGGDVQAFLSGAGGEFNYHREEEEEEVEGLGGGVGGVGKEEAHGDGDQMEVAGEEKNDESDEDDEDEGGEGGGGGDDDEEEDDDDEEAEAAHSSHGQSAVEHSLEAIPNPNGRCDVLWQGQIARRLFTGFKFQECKTSSMAKKLLEGKNVGHYWDMLEHADSLLASGQSDDLLDLLG